MVLSDENNHPNHVKPFTSQGEAAIGNRKFGVTISHNRRVLGTINRKLAGTQAYPCVVNLKHKRGSSESHKAQDENLPRPTHRPITRNFAAQIASTRQHCHEETKKHNPSSTLAFTIFEDCAITDVEHQEIAPSDHPIPMSLEQIENVSNEKDQMEVEMEDIFEETVMDIDSCDENNPLAVIEYVDDLFSYYKRMEECSGVSPNYMSQQVDINEKMRSILIDWLIEVHHKFELREETLFLTVNLIDRFLAQQSVVRKKLQLVGLVAMLLACKYEEVSVPVVDDLIFISDKAYTKKELLDMEKIILNVLQFNMSVPTPYVFLRRYLKAAESDTKLELLSFFLIELCLVEYEMIKYAPSLLAAAAIYTAQCSLYGFKQWTKTCVWYTGFAENQLLECSKLIVSYHKNASTGRLTGVHRKYCTSKFGYAAKSGPANFLIEEEDVGIQVIYNNNKQNMYRC